MKVTTAAIILHVSALLGDQREGAEFTTWSEALLRACLVEALTALQPLDSTLARDESVLPLVAGHYQTLPDQAREDVQVLAADVGGVKHSDFIKVAYTAIAQDAGLAPKTALKAGLFASEERRTAWSLNRWAWDSNINPSALLVYPPVPDDHVPRVLHLAHARNTASVGASFNMSSKFYRALVAFMLYRAYSVSTDSPSHAKLAENFLVEYNSLVGAKA